MKKCPKCHAELEENARFCLYCMTSLEEKKTIEFPKENKKSMIYATVFLLTVTLLIVGFFVFYKGDNSSDLPDTSSADNATDVVLSSTTDNNTSSTTGDTVDNTTNNMNSDKPAEVQPSYEYEDATQETAYPPGHATVYPLTDVIVITKVTYVEPSGNYVIPETIDGKRVAAIMPQAFSEPEVSAGVVSVTLPATVKTLWNDAFQTCYNLKDLYVKSGTIGIDLTAFPEKTSRLNTITIHCKKDCKNFDFYYYRNIANQYDALYEEWNG